MRHGWAKYVLHDLEYNPHTQFKFHIAAMGFWILNLLAGTTLMFTVPHLWLSIGVFYVFVLSIYANFDTDFDAISACLGAINSENVLRGMSGDIRETDEVEVVVEHRTTEINARNTTSPI